MGRSGSGRAALRRQAGVGGTGDAEPAEPAGGDSEKGRGARGTWRRPAPALRRPLFVAPLPLHGWAVFGSVSKAQAEQTPPSEEALGYGPAGVGLSRFWGPREQQPPPPPQQQQLHQQRAVPEENWTASDSRLRPPRCWGQEAPGEGQPDILGGRDPRPSSVAEAESTPSSCRALRPCRTQMSPGALMPPPCGPPVPGVPEPLRGAPAAPPPTLAES
ncbi:proline-rich protein 2-like [Herpailurus yagouaroundi]|uniref:proline-rich protein 2-like n=1 Tax=Herpailurus yagouaroundi TaxID=1608482 RepID=UPI001AD71AB7|nr:proline-rich protein 2-like [Puma yagouaroundi]